MADDQKPKTMDINDLVRELSKSSTSPTAPSPAPLPQATRPSFPTLKPSMPPIMPRPTSPSTSSGSMASPSAKPFVPVTPPSPVTPPQPKPLEMPKPQFNVPPQPKPAPTTPGVKEYQSSIRTMSEDISRLKQGQQPMGVPVPRKVEQIVPVPPQATPAPAKPPVTGPQFKIPDVNLGETKRSAPLAQSKNLPGITIPSIPKGPSVPKVGGAVPAPQIYVPQEGQPGGNRNMLFIGIGVVAVVAGFAYWFFVLRAPAPEVVIETPTPTPIEIPTPTPPPLDILGVAENIFIPSTSVFLTSLTTAISSKQPVAGQIRLYNIVDENQQKYSFKEFLIKLSIDTSTLNDSGGLLDTHEWVLGLYGQLGTSQGISARPFIVFTQKDSNLATGLMNTWEPRIINDLAKLFNLGKLSPQLSFTSDVYSGVSFRFVRIPNKDSGIAYAIFQNYLVLGSSRDSFRAVISVLALRPD